MQVRGKIMDLTIEKVTISADHEDDILIVRCHGRLDVFSTPDIEKMIADHVRQGCHKLVLNLHEVTFMSSAGIKMLLAMSVKLRLAQGKFVICEPSTIVLHILRASGFIHVIEIAEDEKNALSILNEG